MDNDGNIYSMGIFASDVDFDPGPGVDIHSSTNPCAFLNKTSPTGNYMWTRTWAGSTFFDAAIYGVGVAFNGSDTVYATGGSAADYFDVDPGPGKNMVWRHWPPPSQVWPSGLVFLLAFPLDGNW